jgi:glycyl-tRNA synthetase beta chain
VERADLIRSEAHKLVAAEGGVLVEDEALVQLVKNLVEKPFPLLGRFDAKFLEVPKELLISEAREHQKYFMVTDTSGALLPCFIVVAGADSKDKAALAAGNARVIRARFEDGAFYYRTDREKTLEARGNDLDKLVFHKALGHYADKAKRLQLVGTAVVEAVSTTLETRSGANTVGVDVSRAALLAKADLISGVVNEFPELQGVMGRYYARLDGENDDVAFAIEDHYAPRHNGASLPRSDAGAIVAIADRLDTLAGIVGVVGVPSGSADPYALRRAGVALLTILIERGYVCDLKQLVGAAIDAYQGQGRLQKSEKAALATSIVDFVLGRLKGVLVDKAAAAGFTDVGDIVDAAMAARGGVDDLPDVWRRVQALAELRASDTTAFATLAATFKRVGNIVKKAREGGIAVGATVPEIGELELPAERDLATSAATLAQTGSHGDTLRQVAALQPAVAKFFDDVMVMVDNVQLRDARLALLASIEGRLVDVADFTRLQA